MRTQSKKLTKGFTIIEVLIVLAIAGLILAIVFLAVPALQRNSRNNAIRSDSANVLAAINEYVANNSGSLPPSTANQTGPTICIGSAPAPCPVGSSEAKVRGGTIVTWQANSNAPTVLGTIYLVLNTKCNGNSFGTYNASPRAAAAGFLVESSGSANSPQCIET